MITHLNSEEKMVVDWRESECGRFVQEIRQEWNGSVGLDDGRQLEWGEEG